MNVDEAMAVASKQGGLPETDEWHAEVIDALDVLSNEVERIRAELARCQSLLDETRTELSICGAFHSVAKKEWLLEVEKVNRLEVELAAAKAASVVPVKWKSSEQFFQSGADRGNQWGIELWFENKEQREQFHKWLKEMGEG